MPSKSIEKNKDVLPSNKSIEKNKDVLPSNKSVHL